jgi:hypothetical protein
VKVIYVRKLWPIVVKGTSQTTSALGVTNNQHLHPPSREEMCNLHLQTKNKVLEPCLCQLQPFEVQSKLTCDI